MSNPTLKRGQRGDDVRTLQGYIKTLGFYDGPLDGLFGRGTHAAVENFQDDYSHLKCDGIVGPATWGMLEQAMGVTRPPEGADVDGDVDLPFLAPSSTRDVPAAFWDHLQTLVKQVVAHKVGYGPGRGLADPDNDRFIVTIGPNRLGNAGYRTADPKHGPAFVCSTWTYFALCFLFRVNKGFNRALAGGWPSLYLVLTKPFEVHPLEGSRYGYYAFGPFFRPIRTDGSTKRRHRRSRGHLDLLELYARRAELPELLLVGQSSYRKNGTLRWDHHTALFWVDREAEGQPLYRIAADGSRSRSGVFSGTDMNVEAITSAYAEANHRKAFYKVYGVRPEAIVKHGILDRPAWDIAFEYPDTIRS